MTAEALDRTPAERMTDAELDRVADAASERRQAEAEEEEVVEVCAVCACHGCTDEEHAAWVIADADAAWIQTQEQTL